MRSLTIGSPRMLRLVFNNIGQPVAPYHASSNRLMPEDNDALLKKNIRQKILQAVYEGYSDATVE